LTTIDQCLAFKVSERPQTMQQVKQRLMPNSLGQAATAQPQYQLYSEPQPPSQPATQTATRQLWPVKWLATSAVLLLLAVGSWQFLQYRAEQMHLAQQDHQAWQLASADHTEQSYQLYLSTQPQGQYRLNAQTQLEVLQAEAAQLQLLVQQQQAEAAAHDQAQAKQVERVLGKLVAIPAGSFMMGCDEITPERMCYDTEKPSRQVEIDAFKLMETEVTFAMWDACVSEGGCKKKPADDSWGRGTRPVINVSFNDITQQFIPWVNNITGLTFRLPSEAEWEYAARAGLSVKDANAQYNCETAHIGQPYSCKGDVFKTLPVKSYQANTFGLFDMIGNVGELVADCHRDNYNDAPTDGSIKVYKNCNTRVWRGGSFGAPLNDSHVSIRGWQEPFKGSYGLGFRLALSQ
ncbi:formylglycine-generating enzyme family protein, partial [Alishewanella tabrizica]|uniref:formylglycine-generating enzyme family protein n=1 Tax=Alishewanella tabrizica TaxID=671278 RepID=UPI001671BFF3